MEEQYYYINTKSRMQCDNDDIKPEKTKQVTWSKSCVIQCFKGDKYCRNRQGVRLQSVQEEKQLLVISSFMNIG